jgi:hypothetical protein
MALCLPKYNAVFLHIYKTAGTTLRTELSLIDRDSYEIGGGHSDYSEIEEQVSDKIVFSVVRNPYDWIYSLYQYSYNYNTHPFHAFSITNSFDQFVNWHFENIEILNQTGINGKLQTQTEYLSVRDELKVKHILKMENLEVELNQFFRDVLRHGGIIRLKTLNATPYTKVNPKTFSKQTINLINKNYEKDFRNFNYQMI